MSDAASAAADPSAEGAAGAAPAPREGTLAVDDKALFESQVVVYEQMLHLTNVLADGVRALPAPRGGGLGDPTYVVVAPAELEAFALLGGVAAAARAVGAACAGVAPPPPPAPAPDDEGARDTIFGARALNPFAPVAAAVDAVRGVARAAAGLAAMLRVDRTVTDAPVAVDDRALALQVAGELAFRGLRVRVPGVFAPAAARPDAYAALEAAHLAHAAAAARVAARAEADRAADAARLQALGEALARLEGVALGTGGAGGAGDAAAAVLALRQAGALAAEVRPGVYLVRPHVVASGGSRRETRGGLKGVLGAALELGGGLVVNLAVFDREGTLVGGGTWARHSGHAEFDGRLRPPAT